MKIIVISGKSGHGKDTLAKMIKKELESKDYNVLTTHFADLLKYVCKEFFDWDGKKDDPGRSLLQYVGTDIVRKKQPDFWTNFLIEMFKLFPNEWDYVLIPDCRFPDEIVGFRESGFDIRHIRISRPNFDSGLTEQQQNHTSETALDNYSYDYFVENDSTLKTLKREAKRIIADIGG